MTEADEDINGCVDMLDGRMEVLLTDTENEVFIIDVTFTKVEVLDWTGAGLGVDDAGGGVEDRLLDTLATEILLLFTTLTVSSDILGEMESVADICAVEPNTEDD